MFFGNDLEVVGGRATCVLTCNWFWRNQGAGRTSGQRKTNFGSDLAPKYGKAFLAEAVGGKGILKELVGEDRRPTDGQTEKDDEQAAVRINQRSATLRMLLLCAVIGLVPSHRDLPGSVGVPG